MSHGPPVAEKALRLAMPYFAALDRVRRAQGAWLDGAGLGPVKTPSQVVWKGPRARLLSYETEAPGPALLILPAPIKRAYIWDLAPNVSVVRRCLAAGLRVYLLEWAMPDGSNCDLGLSEHVEKIIVPALGAARAANDGRPVFMAGHSLGGSLAAIAATLAPEWIAGLVLVEAPLRFGRRAGAFAPLIARTPTADVAALGGACVPGSLLSLTAIVAAPDAFVVAPWLDRLMSVADGAAHRLHLRVQRWALDEMPMPGALFIDIVERLYREDRFSSGTLVLSSGPVGAEPLATIPVLAVVASRSRVVPRDSALGLFPVLRMKDLRVLPHAEETGMPLQHVGALAGRTAHRTLWPKILAWIIEHAPR
jgi:polyhydroxyalkanoate synthase